MADFPHDPEETLFGAAFQALPDAACIAEPIGEPGEAPRDWRYLAANAALCRLLGVEDPTGKTLGERFPEAAEVWSHDFERVIARGTPEVLVRQGAQTDQIFEVVLSPLRFAGRSAIMARVRDVSGEHLAREKRREADARYKLLFEAIDEGFCIVEVLFDADGTPIDYLFLEGNEAFLEQSGLVKPLGKTMRALQPDIEDKWIAAYGRVALTGVPERFESESAAMDRWFDVFAFPVGDQAPYQV
ncbi:MAG TPA: PAS domain-containing protein, partial [Erythrobacter sp.]